MSLPCNRCKNSKLLGFQGQPPQKLKLIVVVLDNEPIDPPLEGWSICNISEKSVIMNEVKKMEKTH